jgi:bifunctional UDP-N-acetylglucosamine pyrophosphorylase/glucosamine-1-phosphate N-acetyltransferase
VQEIVEAGDASPEQRAVREVNGGVYAFEVSALLKCLDALAPHNTQADCRLESPQAARRWLEALLKNWKC